MRYRFFHGWRCEAVLRCTIALVQLAAIAWVPVAHAHEADGASGPALEHAHGADCSEIHADVPCAACAFSRADLEPTPHPAQGTGITHRRARDVSPEVTSAASTTCVANAVRAPPSS